MDNFLLVLYRANFFFSGHVGYGCLYWLFSLDDVLLPDSKNRGLHRGLNKMS